MPSSLSAQIVNIVQQLETHKTVLEAELNEIDHDMERCMEFNRKYGSFWMASITRLKQLTREKTQMLKEINMQMDLFTLHLESGKELIAQLNNKSPIQFSTTLNAGTSGAGALNGEQLVYAVVSPILAHSELQHQ